MWYLILSTKQLSRIIGVTHAAEKVTTYKTENSTWESGVLIECDGTFASKIIKKLNFVNAMS
jgi:hypothetical protein